MSSNTVEEYGWKAETGTWASSYIVPPVIARLKRLGVHRVLDLGAGNGHLCGLLAAEGFDVVGVEYDRMGVEIAKRAHPAIKFYCFGVQDNPQELLATEAPFDAVVSTEVIEHLFSPHLLPAFANAVLKPRGALVITTPYHGYLKNLLIALLGKWDWHHTTLWHGGHIKFWSRATLSQLLTEQGFRVTRFQGISRAPYLWRSMLLVAEKV
ncbi:MAG: class I SAM-dependent methyltransferase [Alcaligenaceae bacterium]|nr:MAG: class I SAM-dependent methyltransferase [Alcaligenaceae bacterium]